MPKGVTMGISDAHFFAQEEKKSGLAKGVTEISSAGEKTIIFERGNGEIKRL
jgi:hypothetical protein